MTNTYVTRFEENDHAPALDERCGLSAHGFGLGTGFVGGRFHLLGSGDQQDQAGAVRWLNVAEIELSVMTKQCLDRRIPDLATLRRETSAWATQRNEDQTGVDWQFATDDARIKLKRLYPQCQMS